MQQFKLDEDQDVIKAKQENVLMRQKLMETQQQVVKEMASQMHSVFTNEFKASFE